MFFVIFGRSYQSSVYAKVWFRLAIRYYKNGRGHMIFLLLSHFGIWAGPWYRETSCSLLHRLWLQMTSLTQHVSSQNFIFLHGSEWGHVVHLFYSLCFSVIKLWNHSPHQREPIIRILAVDQSPPKRYISISKGGTLVVWNSCLNITKQIRVKYQHWNEFLCFILTRSQIRDLFTCSKTL